MTSLNSFKILRVITNTVTRRYSAPAGTASSSSKQSAPDVPGLSSAVLKVPSGEVGPGASKSSDYKNPEYFCYNKTSYFEAEIEMLKYRLPQPSSKSKK